jgi:nicotinamidase-related amidase
MNASQATEVTAATEATAIPAYLPGDMQSRWYNSAQFTPEEPWRDLAPRQTALVLVDLINWQAHPNGASVLALRERGNEQSADYFLQRCDSLVLPRLLDVLPVAREAGIAVVHARLASRVADYTDLVPAFQPYLRGSQAREGSWGTEPLDGLWQDGDISVTKHGSGAFSSDLDTVLRHRGIDTLLYAGVVTNACVLLSTAAGFDLGYRQYLLSDCTAALTQDEQQWAEQFINNYLAQVVDADSAVRAFEALRPKRAL